MFDRFTDHAREVMGLALQEAQRLGHDYIGTEHVLLGLIEERSGVAADVLKILDVDLKNIRQEVEKLVSRGTTTVTMGQLPFTPRGKKVLEFTEEEAVGLGHHYLGTEHLLLGLIREQEGIAARVLQNINVCLGDVREAVRELLGPEPDEQRTRSPSTDAEVGNLREFGREALSSVQLLELIRELEERVRKLEEKSGDG